MEEIFGEVDHVEKGQIDAPGVRRVNHKTIPVLRLRILMPTGKLVQVLYKGDYPGDVTIGHEITVKGIDKGGVIYATSIFNNTTNSWITSPPGCINCFIATAVYGSPFAKEVIFLRFFRDNYLMKRKLGIKLITYYYNISPSLAKKIVKNKLLKKAANYLLLIPSIKIIKIYIKVANKWNNK